MRKFRFLFVLPLVITLTVLSCSEDDAPETEGFDRAGMLASVANNLIIPNFEQLENSVANFSTALRRFEETQSEENLTALQVAWVEVVTDHQHCSAFGFGPGDLTLGPYATVIGVFPVNETQIEANIISGDFDPATSFDRSVRGFYAIEYLIYGKDQTVSEVVNSFDQNRLNYLSILSNEIDSTIKSIVSEWRTSYLEEFIANDGTSAGSSVSLLYNEFVKDYENLKNFKVELPAGLTAGQSGSNGALVEAFYSGISSQLIAEHFSSSKNIWSGNTRSGADIVGFVEYLNSVVGGPELVSSTKVAISQIDVAIADLSPGRLSDQVDNSEVRVLRDELQANTANFKSSMSSLLGISITFNSGDGD